jgi:hypothetical protein
MSLQGRRIFLIMKTDNHALPRPAVSRYDNVGYELTTTTDETLLSKPSDGSLGIIEVIAHAPASLTSPTITLKDGTKTIGVFPISAGDTEILIENSIGLKIAGDLVAQASAAGVVVSGWAVKG